MTSWSLPSKVMLPYNKLPRGFAIKETTHNLRFSWSSAVKKRHKKLTPKLTHKLSKYSFPHDIL